MSNLDGRFVALQSKGKRDYQEDDYGLLDNRSKDNDVEHTVIVVADGMGGHVAGARASALVTEVFVDSYPHAAGSTDSKLKIALNAANDALGDAVNADAELDGMGCTLLAAVVSGDESRHKRLSWLSVGDSPMWLYRDGQLRRLNADHSMTSVLADMVASGKIDQEDADADPNRHSLLSAVMGSEIELVDQPEQALLLDNDDLLLMASDGIQTLNDEEIASCLEDTKGLSIDARAEALLKTLEDVGNPNQDNITIVLYSPFLLAEPATVTIEQKAPKAINSGAQSEAGNQPANTSGSSVQQETRFASSEPASDFSSGISDGKPQAAEPDSKVSNERPWLGSPVSIISGLVIILLCILLMLLF